jgi:hypothetical protein
MKPQQGIVQSFDMLKGEGVIELANDETIPFSRAAVLLPDPNMPGVGERVTFVRNDGSDGPFAAEVAVV